MLKEKKNEWGKDGERENEWGKNEERASQPFSLLYPAKLSYVL